MGKGKLAGGVMALALPFVAGEEGLRTEAYLDSVGVPTICYGETTNVRMGDVKTKDECNALFYVRLGYFAMAVDYAVEPDLSPQAHAAFTSLAYNVGLGAFKKSTLLKKANNNDMRGACEQLLRWNRAGGIVLKGLTKRRERERELCLSGL